MKNSSVNSVQLHPMVIFWMGILTGALIVGLVFFYRFLNPAQYETAILKNMAPMKTRTLQIQPKMAPKSLNAFPTPPGGMTAFPTPPGG